MACVSQLARRMLIPSFTERHSAWAALPLVAASAYLQTKGAMSLTSPAVERAPQSHSNSCSKCAQPTQTGAREHRTAESIVNRNPFDTRVGLVVTERSGQSASPDALSAPDCSGFTAVIVTQSNDATWSVAALQGPDEPRPVSRRVGDRVSDKLVTYIGFNPRLASPSVWMVAGRSLCQVTLFFAEHRADPATVLYERASGIRQVSETAFRIERAAVDRLLESAADWTRRVRLVPETRDGRVVGLRLFGIRPDSPLGGVGLVNGDRLESINGFDVSTPERALEAYARLRTASHLRIALNRAGKPLALDYAIE